MYEPAPIPRESISLQHHELWRSPLVGQMATEEHFKVAHMSQRYLLVGRFMLYSNGRNTRTSAVSHSPEAPLDFLYFQFNGSVKTETAWVSSTDSPCGWVNLWPEISSCVMPRVMAQQQNINVKTSPDINIVHQISFTKYCTIEVNNRKLTPNEKIFLKIFLGHNIVPS